MLASLLADTLLLLHLGWIAFAVLGALLILRWRTIAFVHPIVVGWSAWVSAAGWVCPLTPAENWLRRVAGQSGYEGGFMEHYLAPVIYPAGLTPTVQIVLGLSLLAFNILAYLAVFKYRRYRRGD